MPHALELKNVGMYIHNLKQMMRTRRFHSLERGLCGNLMCHRCHSVLAQERHPANKMPFFGRDGCHQKRAKSCHHHTLLQHPMQRGG